MNRRCSGLQLILMQSLVTHGVQRRSMKSTQITRHLATLPDAKRPSSVGVLSEESGSVKKSRGAGTRSFGVQGQPVGKEEDCETSDEHGLLCRSPHG